MTTYEDFTCEIQNAKKRMPYDMGLISRYIMEHRQHYVLVGSDNPQGYYGAELLKAIYDAAPVIDMFVLENERKMSDYVAAYLMANKRKTDADNDVKFWQSVSIGISVIAVVYCMFRAMLWLAPAVQEMIRNS